MNCLVVYYSQTGNTKEVSEKIASLSGADSEQIVEEDTSTLSRMVKCALRGATKTKKPAKNPADYDLVVVGSPVWMFSIPPAVRGYLGQNCIESKKVGLFCTMGGKGASNAFKHVKAELIGCEVVGELALSERELKDADEKISQWVTGLLQQV